MLKFQKNKFWLINIWKKIKNILFVQKSPFCPFYSTKTTKQHVFNKWYYGYYYGILIIVMRKEHGIRQQTVFFAIISFILNVLFGGFCWIKWTKRTFLDKYNFLNFLAYVYKP